MAAPTYDGAGARVYDFVAIGLGPFNLGLACLTDPIDELDGVFLESKEHFDWHPEMLLEHATLQVPFLADLVTLADPTSPFSFLNYLKEKGRIYSFYIRESFYPLRSEFNDYCQWASQKLASVVFDRYVHTVEYDEGSGLYDAHSTCRRTGEQHLHRGRRLVLGIGTSPYVPEEIAGLGGPVVHNSAYLSAKAELQCRPSITILGSGQSAAEIYHDLLQEIDVFGYTLNWVTRSPRFFPLEYTKLTLEMTSPEYTDYFHGLPQEKRDSLLSSQKGLYKGISTDLVDDIFDLLYTKRLTCEANPSRGDLVTNLITNAEITGGRYDAGTNRYGLDLFHHETDQEFELTTHGLVLATGYRTQVPEFLAPVRDRIRWDSEGRFAVRRDYSIDDAGGGIFVQNAEEHTHGFVAPDLGMGAYRNACLIATMLGREYYSVEKRIAFQHFGVPDAEALTPAKGRV